MPKSTLRCLRCLRCLKCLKCVSHLHDSLRIYSRTSIRPTIGRPLKGSAMRLLLALALVYAATQSAAAQAFSNASGSLAGMPPSPMPSNKSCESLSTAFKTPEIDDESRRASSPPPPIRRTTAHVVGMIKPEVAFEVNLPDPLESPLLRRRQRRPGRPACRCADEPGARHGAHQWVRDGAPTRVTTTVKLSGTFILSNPRRQSIAAYAPFTSPRIRQEDRHQPYAKPISFSCWNSCSNGGRQGLLERNASGGLRRYCRQRSVGRPDRSSPSARSGTRRHWLGSAGAAREDRRWWRRGRWRSATRSRRPQGQLDRRPAQVQLRSRATSRLQRRRRLARLRTSSASEPPR